MNCFSRRQRSAPRFYPGGDVLHLRLTNNRFLRFRISNVYAAAILSETILLKLRADAIRVPYYSNAYLIDARRTMKLNPNYILREIGDTSVLVPFGKTLIDFNTMLTVNAVGAFLLKMLTQDTTEDALVQRLVEFYKIDAERAALDVSQFLKTLRQYDVLIETAEELDAINE